MSNELDLNTTQETMSSPLASPVNSKPTDETATATSDSESKTLSVGNGSNKASESQIQNKRKKNQPIKSSSLLLLKCVEEANVDEEVQPEGDEDEQEEPVADIEDDVPVEDEGAVDQLQDEVEDQMEDQLDTNEFIDENEPDVNGMDQEDDEEEGSFEMESNYDDYNTNDNQVEEADVSEKHSIKKKQSLSSKSHFNGISDLIQHTNSPLANNAFLNNRNMELFAQTFLEKHQQNQQQNGQQQQQSPMIKSYNQHQQQQSSNQPLPQAQSSKKQMRFQCRFCVYKSHSVSLMQNHIYRHIDTTPYSCFYCGHKSTTKSTIMVHIELCHPNMEVKIKESRVKEEDYYIDLNSSDANNNNNSATAKSIEFLKENKHSLHKFEIIPNKCQMSESQQQQQNQNNNSSQDCPPPPAPPVQSQLQQQPNSLSSLSSASLSSTVSNSSSPSSTASSISSLCSSPSVSPVPTANNATTTTANKEATANNSSASTNNDNLLLQVNPEHLKNGGFSANHQFENDEDTTNNSSNNSNNNSGVTVFNRPKQYFGSLYEPDKQYSCKLCTYTTNHKPSMEDHVYVHTNKRPYRCGYCDEEIYTRYAATYHNKYKHPGEPRNFIKDEQDVSIYYVNRAKNGSTNANGTGKESMASNNSHSNNNNHNNSQTASNDSAGSHANNDNNADNDNNNSGANFHQYGVVAQHRVLDSKQRCGPDVNTKPATEPSKKSQSQNHHHNHHHHHHNRSGLKSSSGNKLQSPSGSPQFNNNTDLIKVTSFRSANQNSSKPTNKSSNTNNKKYHNESDTLSHTEQAHLLNQNPLAFNAFNQFQPGSPSSTPSSAGNAPNIASALTQFMLAQGISPQQQQLQSLLTGMNPLAQSFNSATPSPSSSTNSNSSSLSTSPSTSSSASNNNSMYDFNLALKMYQIQLQSMMTANYLQSFNASANNSPQQLAMNGQKKRKHHETIDHNNNTGNESDEGGAYSQAQSPRHDGKVKFNSGANKKMSKNTV